MSAKRISKVILLFFMFLGLFLQSCASTKFDGRAVMTGRVSDPRGNPVPNYHISAGIGMEAITDAGGIFVFRNVSSGNYRLKGGGKGWCGTDMDFYFHDRKEIVCIQVSPLESLIEPLSRQLDSGDYDGAKKLLKKSRQENENNPLFDCYDCLIRYCESGSDKSKKKFLESLEKI
ncbi:MAG: carboxypeptidase regulatory-like domain-containing protein [Treponema sp.]|nr:carboxypeptidase regulatory-like domain-containing protein [Treponema sp.]